ncbi:hypothetical protein DXD25_10860 [Prevotella sp. TF12-30]|nr:hypothetical protein DXD25_10860 [Prevotella sp. TF12-30]
MNFELGTLNFMISIESYNSMKHIIKFKVQCSKFKGKKFKVQSSKFKGNKVQSKKSSKFKVQSSK